jgi:hypothetical protein
MRNIILSLLGIILILPCNAQDSIWVQPLDLPMALSASFGELRPNHFHAGLDFKTDKKCGFPIRAVQDGYISRISVAQYGYGNCLYITHPKSGYTSVYAHLDGFNDTISAWVENYQYQHKTFQFNAYLPEGTLEVKQGDTVAISGNTGSSGGPHLHFEVRNTASEDPIDPQNFYRIEDTVCPKFQKIGVRPLDSTGVVSNQCVFRSCKTWMLKDSTYAAPVVTAWGRIGLEFMAFDYMNGQTNFYGLKSLQVFVDDVPYFNYQIDRFSFAHDKAINAFIDYEQWIKNKDTYMCSYLPQYQPLPLFRAQDDGSINIQEERDYHVKAIASDYAGNQAVLNFTIKGKKLSVPAICKYNGMRFYVDTVNVFENDSVRLQLPQKSIYNEFDFRYVVAFDSMLNTRVHSLHYNTLPLHKSGTLRLPIDADTLQCKNQYYLAYRGTNGGWGSVSATYKDGCLEGKISKLGDYAVFVDTVPPTITLLSKSRYQLSWRIKDTQSGIASFNAYVDNQWVLCSIDAKNRITYHYDPKRVAPGKHTVRLEVVDGCGNTTHSEINVVLGN